MLNSLVWWTCAKCLTSEMYANAHSAYTLMLCINLSIFHDWSAIATKSIYCQYVMCFAFIVLLGAFGWAVSMFVSPIVIAICRRKSTRLTAVVGGLVYALGILFASFATFIHQVAFSYGKYTYYVCMCKSICLVLLCSSWAHVTRCVWAVPF